MTKPTNLNTTAARHPSVALSVTIFLIATAFMAWFRLYLFRDQFVALTYGLPLLICLWHRDRVLLWSMALAFCAMSGYKVFFVLPDPNPNDLNELLQWIFQVINIVVIGGAVHGILNVTDSLHARNTQLQQLNEELAAREEEITHQNEELQSQSEEVQQQSEELQAQTEELQTANKELAERQSMLEVLLESLRQQGEDRHLLEKICQSVLPLIGPKAAAAAVVEKSGDQLVVRAHAGFTELVEDHWPFRCSFASVIMQHDKTAFVDDLNARTDLIVPRPKEHAFRSIFATPLRFNGKPVGVVEVYSIQPQSWTGEEFRVLEWAAAQSSLILQTNRLQAELKTTNANLAKTVARRTKELQELVNELEHFSYSITHDMRAPLRAMQGFAGMLTDTSVVLTPEERDSYLHRIKTAAARMDRLITDALSYSKAVQQELILSSVDPVALLKGMIDSYPQFQPPHAIIEVQPGIPTVLANEAGLTQCFSNLLGNAIKFMEQGKVPHVKIAAEQHEDAVRLRFLDNGIGIAPEMLPRVFDMFQRASKSYEGTGIGLALVRKVMERMGGKVGVSSELGKGSCFWLELKRAG